MDRKEQRRAYRADKIERTRTRKIEKAMERKLPRFVKFRDDEGSSVFRKTNMGYWIDNGAWGVDYKFGPVMYDPTDYKEYRPMISVSDMKHLNGRVLVEATEAEWIKSVGQYKPSGVKLNDGYMSYGKYIPYNEPNPLKNPCAEIPLGEMQECSLRYEQSEETNYRYLLLC